MVWMISKGNKKFQNQNKNFEFQIKKLFLRLPIDAIEILISVNLIIIIINFIVNQLKGLIYEFKEIETKNFWISKSYLILKIKTKNLFLGLPIDAITIQENIDYQIKASETGLSNWINRVKVQAFHWAFQWTN